MTTIDEAPSGAPGSGANPERHLGIEHLQDDLRGRTVRGAAVNFVSQSLKFTIGFSGTVVLARLLTPEDYGLVGMIAVFSGFVIIFRDLGLSAATVQRADLRHAQISVLFWVSAAAGTILAFVIAAMGPAFAWLYGEPRLTAIAAVAAVGIFVGGFGSQQEALLKRQMRFTALAAVEVTTMLTGVSIAIVLAWYNARYWSIVVSQLAAEAAFVAGVWTVSGWRPGLPARASGIRSMLVFGGHITGFRVLNYWARSLDRLLIGRIWGPHQLGLYSRAYQLFLLPIDQINGPISAIAIPALSRLADSPERYRQAYVRLVEKPAMITMPIAAFLIATSDWLVWLILGPQWSEVSTIFAWLGLAGLTEPIACTAAWLFITQGRTQDLFRWGWISSALTAMSVVLGLPWGAVGVAASYSLTAMLFTAPLLVYFVTRTGPVRASDICRAIAPPAFASVSGLIGVVLFRRIIVVASPGLGVIAGIVIMIVVVALILSALPSGRLALLDLWRSAAGFHSPPDQPPHR